MRVALRHMSECGSLVKPLYTFLMHVPSGPSMYDYK